MVSSASARPMSGRPRESRGTAQSIPCRSVLDSAQRRAAGARSPQTRAGRSRTAAIIRPPCDPGLEAARARPSRRVRAGIRTTRATLPPAECSWICQMTYSPLRIRAIWTRIENMFELTDAVGDGGRAAGRAVPGRRPVRRAGSGRMSQLEFLPVLARSVLNRLPKGSPGGFRWTINAYRGCSHACKYCFARPTHEYLGLDAGADFDHKIVVKVNAVELLRRELADPRWTREQVAMGTNTDPYQRAEAKFRLTRGIIAALADADTPFSILTKSPLVTRDLDLLTAAAARCTSASRSRSARWTRTCGGSASRAARTRCAASTRCGRWPRPASRPARWSRRSCPASPTGASRSRAPWPRSTTPAGGCSARPSLYLRGPTRTCSSTGWPTTTPRCTRDTCAPTRTARRSATATGPGYATRSRPPSPPTPRMINRPEPPHRGVRAC